MTDAHEYSNAQSKVFSRNFCSGIITISYYLNLFKEIYIYSTHMIINLQNKFFLI